MMMNLNSKIPTYPVLSWGRGHHGPGGPGVVDVGDGVGGRGRHLHPLHPESAADQGIMAVDGDRGENTATALMTTELIGRERPTISANLTFQYVLNT